MTIYLKALLNRIENDNGKAINLLIDKEIINYKEVLELLLYNGTDEELYKFAKYVKVLSSGDREFILNELIRRKNSVYLLYYACEIEGAPIVKIEKAIIEIGISDIIRLFALKVKGANIPLLEKAIIEKGNAENIYFFAKDVNGANIDNLTNAIINTNDARYICLFAKYVKGANIELLEDALINIGNLDEYKDFLVYKQKVQEEYYTMLYNAIKDNNIEDLERNKTKYAYLFREPSTKAKALVKKISDQGY